MSAVIRAVRGGLGGRRLQAVIIGLVVLAATATSTVAIALLANAHGPFDRAFARQHGADVAALANASLAGRARLAATTRLAGVTAAAGPFAEVSVTGRVTARGSSPLPLRVVGRASAGGAVDDVTIDQGHWPENDQQIVMERGTGVFAGSTVTIGSRKLTVVGVADSVTDTADAWVLPPEVPVLARRAGHAQAQLLYRFADAGSPAAIAADVAAIRAVLPGGALLGASSWLTVRKSEQGSVAPFVPFIVAFAVIALAISVLIVVNVVSGAVLAGTTRIGVLKSIGFTPAQVVVSYVLLVAAPALAGCLAGAVCGNLLAVPMLRLNAAAYQVGTLAVPFWVDAGVPLGALALTVAASVPPALRAGRLSAVAAIAAGRAPRPGHGYFAHRVLARLTAVPRPATLGLAQPSARPGRTLVTVAAIVFGAAAVTFGVGLAASLDRVVSDRPEAALPVQVSLSQTGPASGGPGPMAAAQQRAVVVALAAQPGTLHYLAVSSGQVSLPGSAASASITAYRGSPAWSGFPLISGRWYAPSGRTPEADVNTLFLTDTGTSVGSAYSLISGTHRVTVRIVGEVFDPGGHNVDVYLSPATLAALDPAAGPGQYDVALRPGTSPRGYASAVSAILGRAYFAATYTSAGRQYLAVVTLVAMLTLLIMAVAGLGVLNTVALQISERAHDIGVLKAIGMTPGQTLAMIVWSVAATGLGAGIAAVPAGLYLHRGVLPVMAHAANSGYPNSLIAVYTSWQLVLLALAGLVIAVAGALGPASRSARSRTAVALRAE